NLRQVGLATMQYADTYKGAFPVGSYACCSGTWLVALLPYIEQKALFDNYKHFGDLTTTDTTVRYSGSVNLPVTRNRIQAYTCPSDAVVDAPNLRSGITWHNYVANHGNTTKARTATFGTMLTGQQ